MSWLKDLIEYSRTVENLIIAAIFSVVNVLIRPAHAKVAFYFVELFISIAFASLVGVISTDLGLSVALTYTLVASSALFARDFLTLVVGFSDYVTDKKDIVFMKVLDYLLGKLK